ncbi:MAG: single-stranded DNA-binding protein [Actinomycetota bacterium]|nr:single-stranded DNA-binding protein [Actinomycetota bacterium]
MTDTLTLTGLVATTPRHLVTGEGLSITSFRLASTQRRYDRGAQKWIDGETNWYTVTCFRQLAANVVGSIEKGQRIVVSGRLRVRDWQSGDRAGTTVEIDADALGHDLAWGTSVYTRSVSAPASHEADAPTDQAAVLDEDSGENTGESSGGELDGSEAEESGDSESDEAGETAHARSKRPLQAVLPF